jgi:hypothetical protein
MLGDIFNAKLVNWYLKAMCSLDQWVGGNEWSELLVPAR